MITVNPSNLSDDVTNFKVGNGSMYGTNRSDWFNSSDLHTDNTNMEVDPISALGDPTSTSNTTNDDVTVNEQQLRMGDIVSIRKPEGVNYKFNNADGKIVKFVRKNNKRAIIQWFCPIKKMPSSSVHNVTTLIHSPNNITSRMSFTHNGKVRVTTTSETSTSELDDFQYDLTYFFTKKYSTRRRLNFNSS